MYVKVTNLDPGTTKYMPSKYYQRDFAKGHYYHLFNRGSHKNKIFLDKEDYDTFMEVVEYYLNYPLGKPFSLLYRDFNKNDVDENYVKVRNLDPKMDVKSSFDIVCFCLMPNHYHFLLKQVNNSNAQNSITNFMRRLNITYSMYFNHKYKHSGNLLQGRYKNVLVKTDSQLLHLSKYIHKNPEEVFRKNKKLSSYKYSSYPSYIKIKNSYSNLVKIDSILLNFSNNNPSLSYKQYVEKKPLSITEIERIIID